MSSDAIYLISDSGELQRVEHQLYASEDILQELVAKHPDVLAGDQIDPEAPPQWLLLRREAAIPDSSDGTGRWWLDHLLLDQFGVPTLVEVKRSTDTRIRREVIGQMLDYVANAQSYWAAGRMRQMLADETGSLELADSRLADLLGLSDEPAKSADQIERFWHTVETNLRDGNVRLLFVADELPRELRKLIEFLNVQFSKIEVLGIELRQYVGQGVKALVPRVFGRTEAARERKDKSVTPGAGSAPVTTTREAFLSLCSAHAQAVISRVLDSAVAAGYEIRWGTKGFSLRLTLADGKKSVFYGYPPGASVAEGAVIEAYVGYITDAEARERFANLFLGVRGFARATDKTVRCVLDADAAVDVDALAAALQNGMTELTSNGGSKA